jgi:hypothetical protein
VVVAGSIVNLQSVIDIPSVEMRNFYSLRNREGGVSFRSTEPPFPQYSPLGKRRLPD